MKKFRLVSLLQITGSTFAQRFSRNEISINAFRNPSIGLEYRRNHVLIHAGYYVTTLNPGVTTKFAKTSLTYWFLPVGQYENSSSFYASVFYLHRMNLEYAGQNAASAEIGFRWMVWRGLNLRLGVIALASAGNDLRINPAPGSSYSFHW